MSHDILAGLLPAGNPLAPFDAAAARRAADADADSDVDVDGAANIATDAPAVATTTPPAASSPIGGDFAAPVVQPPAVRRPRRSLAGPLVAAFAVLLFAAVGACLYLLTSGLGISPDGDLVAVETSPGKPAATQPAPAIVENEIAGNEAERLPRSLLASENVSSGAAESDDVTADAIDGEATGGNSSRDDEERPEAMELPAVGDEANATAAEQSEPAWELVHQTLRSGRFAEMPAVTVTAMQQATTPEQRDRAQRLHRLAELAAQYDEAVRSGAAGLGAGETFELAPELGVLVVESSRDVITLRFEGRKKTYSLDSVPLVLAHSLARFVLPEGDPVAAAARGAYQALWPQASDAHRRQSFQWWRDLEGSGVAGDAAELEPVVRELYAMPAE